MRTRDDWLGVELRHFAALAEVADQRSFRGAAERLGYVQSAISRQVAYLEQVAGMRLVERSHGPKPVRLTLAGELVVGHANDIRRCIEAAKRDLALADEAREDVVRLGLPAGVPTRILSLAQATFGARRPGAAVAREAVGDAPLYDMLRKGTVDLVLAELPPEPGSFTIRELVRVPWVLVAPSGSEIAQRRDGPVSSAELARLPLIATRGHASIEHRLAGPAGRPRIVMRCDTLATVQALVGAGVGFGLLPRLALIEHDPRTVAIELGDMLPPAAYGLIWHRDRAPQGIRAEFRDVICDVAARLGVDAQRGRSSACEPEPNGRRGRYTPASTSGGSAWIAASAGAPPRSTAVARAASSGRAK